MHKSRSVYRDGHKAHIAVEPEKGIIAASTLTRANATDGSVGVHLRDGEDPGLQVLAESAYGSGATRAAPREAEHLQAIKPIPLARPRIEGGYTRDDFTIDPDRRAVTCPHGHTVSITDKSAAAFGIRCRGCPLRQRCTTSKNGRSLKISEHDNELVAVRRVWCDGSLIVDYRRYRLMGERSIAWIVTNGHRRVRYRGVQENRTQLALRIAAMNFRRLVNLGLNRNGDTWATT